MGNLFLSIGASFLLLVFIGINVFLNIKKENFWKSQSIKLSETAMEKAALIDVDKAEAWSTLIMRSIISLVVLAASLFIILKTSPVYPGDTQKWAFGAVGLVIGYWLPTKK